MTASHHTRGRWRVAALALLIQLGSGCSGAGRPLAAAGTAGQAQTGAAAGAAAVGGGPDQAGMAGSVSAAGRVAAGAPAAGSGGAAAPDRDAGGESDDAGVTSRAGAGGTPEAGGGGGPAMRTGVDAVLCDGTPGITFAAVMTLGGQPNIGTPMMAENGYRYLLVEGTCRFWIQPGRLERVMTGQLSPTQLQRLRESFQMQRWQELVGNYPAIGFDTPGYFYALGRGKLSQSCGRWGDAGGCIQFGMGSPVMVGENFSWLHTAFLQVSDELAGSGAPAMGDVRYMLVEGMATISGPLWSDPSDWPLGDATAVAMSETEASQVYVPGSSRLARGADADALREVWGAFLSYEKSGRVPDMPASGSLAIPIVAGGARYQLFIRDSIPLEDGRGLIAF